MSRPARIVALLVAFLAVAGGAAFIVIHYFLGGPPVEDFTASAAPGSGAAVNIVMQEDPQNTVTSKPDWVSYFIKSPQTGAWVHTTRFMVPAATRVNLTILGYDGCTPLRNPFWSQVTVGHTFSIPGIGLNVPMASPPLTAQLCGTSPCTSGPHTVVSFSFMTPSTGGDYIWQCRVPCGGGFLDGFGGPMQTIGYMTGDMQVVA